MTGWAMQVWERVPRLAGEAARQARREAAARAKRSPADLGHAREQPEQQRDDGEREHYEGAPHRVSLRPVAPTSRGLRFGTVIPYRFPRFFFDGRFGVGFPSTFRAHHCEAPSGVEMPHAFAISAHAPP